MKNKDCVVLYEDGITVFVDSPKSSKGYHHFTFDQLEDYGFINMIRSTSGSGRTRLLLGQKTRSFDLYFESELLNYGFMRLTTKDGCYYNIPVADIETVREFLKKHTNIEEFDYIRIVGINDKLQ